MPSYSLSHLSDQALLRDLSALVTRDRKTTAEILAHIAEVDDRRLYLQAGYASMHAYCVDELHLSEDGAYKRIQAARAARRFTPLFAAVAEGLLHLTAVNLLAPHLTAGNVEELVAMATGRRKPEIERGLAERFPTTESLPMVERISTPTVVQSSQLAPAQVVEFATKELGPIQGQPARTLVAEDTPGPKVTVIASERFLLSVTIGKSTHDNLRYAQELLSHCVPSGDVAQVLDRALRVLVRDLEKARFGATRTPRPARPARLSRYLPAPIRRAVWKRDQGRCTFVGESGNRCQERRFVEFDHVHPLARGGTASVEGLRLRCRAHNQYEAERVFGAEFMRRKREEARRVRAERATAAATKARAQEVVPWLRALGLRADEARHAAERCEHMADAPLEERVRVALTCFGPKSVRIAHAT